MPTDKSKKTDTSKNQSNKSASVKPAEKQNPDRGSSSKEGAYKKSEGSKSGCC